MINQLAGDPALLVFLLIDFKEWIVIIKYINLTNEDDTEKNKKAKRSPVEYRQTLKIIH